MQLESKRVWNSLTHSSTAPTPSLSSQGRTHKESERDPALIDPRFGGEAKFAITLLPCVLFISIIDDVPMDTAEAMAVSAIGHLGV
jgi:hypothetical protein